MKQSVRADANTWRMQNGQVVVVRGTSFTVTGRRRIRRHEHERWLEPNWPGRANKAPVGQLEIRNWKALDGRLVKKGRQGEKRVGLVSLDLEQRRQP